MHRLLSHDLWPTVSRLSKNASKRAAIAYVSSDKYVKFGGGDVLICDASEIAIKSGQTSAAVLMRAFKRGADVFSVPGLHAKVLLIDEKAVIGSANCSESSATSLIEAAILTDQPSVVSVAQAFITELQPLARYLDKRDLESRIKIPVVRKGRHSSSSRLKIRGLVGNRTWIIGATELLKDPPEDGGEVSEVLETCRSRLSNPKSSIEWLRWTGTSRFRTECKRNDWIIEMWRSAGRKNPDWVYERMPVIERIDYDSATYFFVEVFPKSDDRAISWSSFKKLARAAGVTRRLLAGSQFEVSERQANALQSLWPNDYLGPRTSGFGAHSTGKKGGLRSQ